eukprot:CAMPEP_0182898306 /NCGR_PEP_ID=MMETSP0034_2-20130328/27405_1 /TAXON_ID=156128 /ORGANISM="Nephroselmis pyriformis, Strain CCMP717" /LENGTH=340 /DNA_ID=CAMNT_0025032269 /DNA_START=203 /DNA_END=1222 /DNA_ORIENTATION=-
MPLSRAQIEAKVAKLMVFGFDGTKVNSHAKRLIDKGFGGAILFKRNVKDPKQVAGLCADLKREAKAPFLIAIDQEGGRVARLGPPFSVIPSARSLGSAADPEGAAQAAGRVLGRELRDVHIDMDLAPVVDVDTNPLNPVIADRSFSRDAAVVGRMGVAMVGGIQGQGVAACVKHWPGHGDTDVDSHLNLPVIRHSLKRLQEVEMPPFKDVVNAGVAAVMVAHVATAALDSGAGDDKGLPATMSKGAIAYLRKELGFDGVVVTDDMEMGAIVKNYSLAGAMLAGIKAGVDLFLVCHSEDQQLAGFNAICDAVQSGEVPEGRLLEAERHVDELRRKYVRAPA